MTDFFDCEFTIVFQGERIAKIGQYLAKLRQRIIILEYASCLILAFSVNYMKI